MISLAYHNLQLGFLSLDTYGICSMEELEPKFFKLYNSLWNVFITYFEVIVV